MTTPIKKLKLTPAPKPAPVERRNGYYRYPGDGRYYPSMTTVMKCIGDTGGLLNWYAKQAARGVLYELAKIKDTESLAQRISTSEAIDWADELGVRMANRASLGARDLGSAVHAAVEEFIHTQACEKAAAFPDWTDLHQDITDSFTKILRDLLDAGMVVEATEDEVFNHEVGYAGRFDARFLIPSTALDIIRPHLVGGDTPPATLPTAISVVADFKTGKSLYEKEHAVQLAGYAKAMPGVEAGLVIGVSREEPDKIKMLWFQDRIESVYQQIVTPAVKIWEYFKAPKWFKEQ